MLSITFSANLNFGDLAQPKQDPHGKNFGSDIPTFVTYSKRKKVLLLKKRNISGGCAGSIARGRFEFELSLAFPFIRNNEVLGIFLFAGCLHRRSGPVPSLLLIIVGIDYVLLWLLSRKERRHFA